MVRIILFVLGRLAPLIRLSGADYGQFRALVEVKLLQDTRRRVIGFQRSSGKQRNSMLVTLIFYGFMGIFVAAFLLTAKSPLVGMTALHSMVLTFLGLNLLADFSTVLLDATDQNVCQPRPISSRTFLLARLAHVGSYLGMLTLAMCIPSFVTGPISYGIAFLPVFLATLCLSNCLAIFLVNVFYAVALRFTNAERFKDIIMYIQIALTVIVVLSYQILPRLMDVQQVRDLDIAGQPWTYFYPPAWMGGLVEVCTRPIRLPALILAAEAVAIPLLGMLIVVRFVAPGFARGLSKLSVESAQGGAPSAPDRTVAGSRLAKWATGTREEYAGFDLTQRIMSKDRSFKLRIYPSVAMALIFPLIILVSGRVPISELFSVLGAGKKYLLFLYTAGFMLPACILSLGYSDHYEAAWMYYALPLSQPGRLLCGTLKALLLRFLVPVFLLCCVIPLVFWGPDILPDIVLGLAATLLIGYLYARFFEIKFPFSEKPGAAAQSSRTARSMILILVPTGFGFAHWGLTFVPFGVWIGMAVELAALMLVARNYARYSWGQMSKASAV